MSILMTSLQIATQWLVTLIVMLLNILGSITLLLASIQALKYWALKHKSTEVALRFGRSFALGIQVLLAAEILRLITIRDLEDLFLVGAVLLLHVIVTILLRYELTHQIMALKKDLDN